MIEFTQDYRVKPDGPDYAKGSRHTMRRGSEDHFIRNGVAVKVGEEVVEPIAVGKPEPVASSPASQPDQASPVRTAARRGRPPKLSLPSMTHGDSAPTQMSSTPATDDGGSTI